MRTSAFETDFDFLTPNSRYSIKSNKKIIQDRINSVIVQNRADFYLFRQKIRRKFFLKKELQLSLNAIGFLQSHLG
ncbi:hypothetical protein LEP1GSC062_4138 [Leptospira alexanderi serovar Manhao 3 str. L 60]|uniref:Uncharacterized protein n=1 Tax=Leptospira alexanderi serovar Manhao 3 str. L 60 TaxID=1049759 RepID=V6HWP7_9LEPT|nr:hypothetical protein LEP1GSC062_4138 [Leptospira alexanderi serovar Manhao 3 str. L 60]